MSDAVLSILCLGGDAGPLLRQQKLYRRFHKLPLMPLVFTPILLVLILVVGHISYQSYMGETHWLLWLLGPATIAFAVPVYENVAVIKRHWMSLSAGVVTAVVVAVTSSVWLARGFMLSDEIQRSTGGALGDHALCAGGGETARRSTRFGGAVCGDHRRVWHGGGRYAVLTSCYPGGGWRKEPGSARLPMVRERRARMSWASRRAWWPAR